MGYAGSYPRRPAAPDAAPQASTFFAACPRNVSDLLAAELRELGIDVTREHPAGVSFHGPLRGAYLACLHSRTASRVLLTLGELWCSSWIVNSKSWTSR